MVAELIPQLEAAISTCDSLIRNPRLTEFLALLLQLGNYLNAVSTILFLLFLASSFKTCKPGTTIPRLIGLLSPVHWQQLTETLYFGKSATKPQAQPL